MPRKRRGGSIPLSPTRIGRARRRAAVRTAASARRVPRILPGRCRSPRPPAPSPPIVLEIEVPAERLDRAIDDAVRHLVAPDARPRLPAGQGAAPRPRAAPRPGRRPRRGRRAPRPGRLPRGARRGGHPAADQRRRRGRPGRGGQAAHLQGDRPGPPRGRARRLQALQLQARDRDDRRRPGRPGHRGAARPERDAGRRRGPRRAGRRLRGHLVRRDRATASRSRAGRPSGCR